MVGIEKLLPRVEDLALFWPLLATSGYCSCLYNLVVVGLRNGFKLVICCPTIPAKGEPVTLAPVCVTVGMSADLEKSPSSSACVNPPRPQR